MGFNREHLNEYGELVNLKESVTRPKDFPEQLESKICFICGRSVDIIYHICSECNDDRAYCSESCFEQHRRQDHYEKTYCAECGSRLGKRYVYGPKLNSALRKELCFCNKYCLNTYRQKHICAECRDRLPNTYHYADDIDRAMGRRVKFCSSYCLQKYRRHELCDECGRELPKTYTYCARCGSNKYRFCGSYCYNQHWKRYHS